MHQHGVLLRNIELLIQQRHTGITNIGPPRRVFYHEMIITPSRELYKPSNLCIYI